MKNLRQKQIETDVAYAREWPVTEPLLPTHSCFDDALDFTLEVLNPELLREIEHACAIVHGLLRINGELTAHGWFECEARALFERVEPGPGENPNPRIVWQGGLARNPVSGEFRRMFYAVLAEPFYRYVEQYSRYTLRLARQLVLTQHTTGPWRREYRELVRSGDAASFGIRGQLEMQQLLCVIDPVAFLARFPASK